jgi:tetratricopeptide (TPR) repeat protein
VERALGNILPHAESVGNILQGLPRPEAIRLCAAWGLADALERLLEIANAESLQAAARLPGAVERLARLAGEPGPRRAAATEALGWAGTAEAASALSSAFAPLWREERRPLHRAALRLGARELLEPLRTVLHHGEPGDEHVFAFLSAVHGVSGAETERARERTLRRAAGELFELELRCEACAAVHAYEVAEAVVDPEESTPFVAAPIACKSCFAVDRYAFTDSAFEVIAAEVGRAHAREQAAMQQQGGGGAEPSPRVRFVRLRALGLSPDPRAALARYEKDLVQRPQDVAALLGRAAALDLLGRADDARASLLDAQKHDPQAVESLLALARDALRRGDAHAQEAFGYALACAQRMKAGQFHHVRDKSAFRAEALSTLALAATRAGVDLETLADLPAPEPAAGAAPKPARRAEMPGRNDPCPCGSGRKYKHCHGK